MNRERILQLLEMARRSDDEIAPGATAEQLAGFETRTGITLPPEVREWLMISNGPSVGRCSFYGIDRDYFTFDDVYESVPEWRERKWLPILDDECGNYWLMATQGEFGKGRPIIFVDTIAGRERATYLAASDLEHFLEFSLENQILSPDLGDFSKCYWPFDRDKVLAKDPAMEGFHVPMPWDA